MDMIVFSLMMFLINLIKNSIQTIILLSRTHWNWWCLYPILVIRKKILWCFSAWIFDIMVYCLKWSKSHWISERLVDFMDECVQVRPLFCHAEHDNTRSEVPVINTCDICLHICEAQCYCYARDRNRIEQCWLAACGHWYVGCWCFLRAV